MFGGHGGVGCCGATLVVTAPAQDPVYLAPSSSCLLSWFVFLASLHLVLLAWRRSCFTASSLFVRPSIGIATVFTACTHDLFLLPLQLQVIVTGTTNKNRSFLALISPPSDFFSSYSHVLVLLIVTPDADIFLQDFARKPLLILFSRFFTVATITVRITIAPTVVVLPINECCFHILFGLCQT